MSIGLLSSFKFKFHKLNESSSSSKIEGGGDQDDEIERLRSMAAKLRADAASLEAEKAQQLADAAEKAFRKFDTNQDGEISVSELKAGLEKVLKTDLSDRRVKQLMEEFDASGDGVLQLDEFVGVDKFRNRLEALAREEKRLAIEAKKAAQKEKELADLAAARVEILNDKPPTNNDKILSILPYLFPLMDGLQYGRFLLSAEGTESNPIVILLAILYGLYRTIPFSGFVAFFALNFLAGNPGINRLIRYNMQQAIFLDIALFFPGLLTGLISLIIGGLGVQLPTSVTEIGTDSIFITLLLTLTYCVGSSLLGKEPDKIPFISQSVLDRMPTLDMFDDQGIFLPEELRKNDDKEDNEEKGDKKD
eukprot:CAMPEP_0184865676 /NCGR_PEP_ID=MMETSP0580-20130426/18789_1 /TAXON_ID=1118495 /ORGANISM="Dactyliosolen fragilissimus" /LENGTH=362 /DNA_ID=CAMNT_0027364965 /DNA_START=225 /DNA_END=1314 /DNA_ORIENTATION=+